MSIEQDILGLPEGQKFTIKELSLRFDCSAATLYKFVGKLVEQGLLRQGKKESHGKMVACYSIPSRQVIDGCQWESHKEMLIASKMYSRVVLETEYWPFLDEEIKRLRENKESLDLLFCGIKGFGKSVSAMWLCCYLDRLFTLRRNVLLRKEEIIRLAIQQPYDMSLVIDDIGTQLDNKHCSESDRRIIFDFFSVCRPHRIDLIGTCPNLSFVDINFRRLIRYVWNVELKCSDHVHIIVSRAIANSEPPKFQPVGIFKLPYLKSFDSLVKQYELYKAQNLRGAARDSLERIGKAEAGVARYVWNNPITTITGNVLLSAISSVGLVAGSLGKGEKERLQVAMYNALQAKKAQARLARKRQVDQGKENLKVATQKKSYNTKRREFIKQGRSEWFAETCSHFLVYDKSRSQNLRNTLSDTKTLFKKVRPALLEAILLRDCHSDYLARDMKVCHDLMGEFQKFDEEFYRKLFAYLYFSPAEAIPWAKMELKDRSSDYYKVKGKYSPNKWRESVNWSMSSKIDKASSIVNDRRRRDSMTEGLAIGADLVSRLFKKSAGYLKAMQEKNKEDQKQEPVFWPDMV